MSSRPTVYSARWERDDGFVDVVSVWYATDDELRRYGFRSEDLPGPRWNCRRNFGQHWELRRVKNGTVKGYVLASWLATRDEGFTRFKQRMMQPLDGAR